MNEKPLLKKGYGSIGHLPDSKLGVGDHCISPKQANIVTKQVRDKHDIIIVTEKLDGTCVGVLKREGILIPINRAGYKCVQAPHLHHRLFHNWVMEHQDDFAFLTEGQRVMGEWLALCHTIRYDLSSFDSPFFAFDLFTADNERMAYHDFCLTVAEHLNLPISLSDNKPLSTKEAIEFLNKNSTLISIDKPEGAVWRLERKGKVQFVAKYVRPDFEPGKYLKDDKWNWKPK